MKNKLVLAYWILLILLILFELFGPFYLLNTCSYPSKPLLYKPLMIGLLIGGGLTSFLFFQGEGAKDGRRGALFIVWILVVILMATLYSFSIRKHFNWQPKQVLFERKFANDEVILTEVAELPVLGKRERYARKKEWILGTCICEDYKKAAPEVSEFYWEKVK